MKKNYLSLAVASILSGFAYSQVGIGTTDPNPSSMLEINSADRGLLMPRVALTDITLASPLISHVQGMVVYNTSTSVAGYVGDAEGLWRNDGVQWVKDSGGSSPATSLIGATSGIVSAPTAGSTTETFLGNGAGASGSSTDNTVFIGTNAGVNAPAARYTTFIGYNAGTNATNATQSNFMGMWAGLHATNASSSNFIGFQSGWGATNANGSAFIGSGSGWGATNASYSNFIGGSAGSGATNANSSCFIGLNAGYNATNAYGSVFIGAFAGEDATEANNSIFISAGTSQDLSQGIGNTGYNATNADNSIFIGKYAGQTATNSSYSNFIGHIAGSNATDAHHSNFIGVGAGAAATNASQSIFIGTSAGQSDTVDNTSGGTSILIGNNTNTGGFSNSIGLGESAVNTASNQFMIGGATTQYDIVNPKYPDTRDDSATTTPANFLYTDGNGQFLSAPLSGIGGGGGGSNALIGSTSGIVSAPTPGATTETFLGNLAGSNGANTSGTVMIGYKAGNNATGADHSILIGVNAGNTSPDIRRSVVIGNGAGQNVTGGSSSVLVGDSAGANNSGNGVIAVGSSARNSAANSSIAIGNSAIANGDYGIALGSSTSNGGFSYSVAFGNGTTNTSSNQFLIDDAISRFQNFNVKADNSTFDGKVGIATTSPNSALTVNGSANNLTSYSAGNGVSIDFANSNLAYTTANAGNTFILSNLKDGGTYTLAVKGTSAGTANFTASGFTVHLPADNGNSTAGKHSMYNFIVMGTDVYTTWVTGL